MTSVSLRPEGGSVAAADGRGCTAAPSELCQAARATKYIRKRSPILRKCALTEERGVCWKGCFQTYDVLMGSRMGSSAEGHSVNESPSSRLRDTKTPLPWLNVHLLAENPKRRLLLATTKSTMFLYSNQPHAERTQGRKCRGTA